MSSHQGLAAASTVRPPLPSTAATGAPQPSSPLTWEDRETIAVQIGEHLARCVAGEHRGTSVRDKIPLGSKLWIVVRDYVGQSYTPVKVIRS